MSKIKLVLLDIDGVLTDGTKMYDLDFKVIGKSFHDHDFAAIKKFRSAGIKVIFISGDDRVNLEMAENRGVDFILADKKEDKWKFILKGYQCKPDEVAFVGDSMYDIGLLKKVGHAFCPSDAMAEVKKVAYPLGAKSGRGVVLSLYQYLERFNAI